MSKPILLPPVEMTVETMRMLEKKNLIIRLAPGKHELPAKPGETLDKTSMHQTRHMALTS